MGIPVKCQTLAELEAFGKRIKNEIDRGYDWTKDPAMVKSVRDVYAWRRQQLREANSP